VDAVEPLAPRPGRGWRAMVRDMVQDLIATHESASGPLQTAGLGDRSDDARPHRSGSFIEQRSLFGEILDWMLVPLLLLWPLSVATTFIVARSLADAPYDRALQDRLRVLAQQVRFAANTLPTVSMPSMVRELGRIQDEDPAWFQFVAPSGEILLGQADLPPPSLYDYPEPGVRKLRQDVYRGEEIRVAYVYVTSDDEAEATRPVLVQMAETLERRSQLANEIIKGVILPQSLILPLAFALVWFGLRRGLGPLKTMRQRIRERAPEDLSPIDPRDVPEEIAPLLEAFNDLLRRLAGNIAGQKRFLADAAHQMKTPLAGLHTQAQLALRERDWTGVRQSLQQIAHSSERAGRVVSQLLALARAENRHDSATLQPVDLDALVRSVLTEWVERAIERGIDIGVDGEVVPAPVLGNPMLLREMLNNLLDNALRYTPRGGMVTARVRAHSQSVMLDVEDNGPGIAPAERTRVFDRFYRILGQQVDGSGLGLAIVREIASQHQATIVVGDTHPGSTSPGARFTLTFARCD
jgi:two-component system, OmpR family, sensor histidine kinase TctE